MSKVENCMLAHVYDGRDPKGWLMSEKMDGVRAIWDGRFLLSRNNKPFFAPEWWLKCLPRHWADGELFAGRGRFQWTIGAVRRHVPDSDWEQVTYQIIEPVKVRANQVVRPITQIVCKGREHLDQFYNDIVENGGEGVMLRNRFESYEFRRSWNLLKVKPEESGTATIVGYEPGLGKYAGMLGSYLCEWRNEIQFKLSGMVDGERAHPLPIGFKVKFRYQCFTDAGVPRFPRKEN